MFHLDLAKIFSAAFTMLIAGLAAQNSRTFWRSQQSTSVSIIASSESPLYQPSTQRRHTDSRKQDQTTNFEHFASRRFAFER
jgi:hypothetical protein